MLDVTNLTAEEMEFEYASGKHLLVESKESCRVPVPLQRCAFLAAPAPAPAPHNHEGQLTIKSHYFINSLPEGLGHR